MTTRLSRSENSLAFVIERLLLEALEIDTDTQLEGRKFSLRFQHV
jgi:hypothetical protein